MRKAMNKNIYRILMMLYILLMSGCSTKIDTTTPTPIPPSTSVPLVTFTVQRGEVVQEINFEGLVSLVDEKPVSFGVAGVLREIFVQVGDTVQQGDILAKLDVSDFEQQLAVASSELERLETDASRKIRKAEITLEIAQKTLDLYRIQGRSELEIEIQTLAVELAQIELDELINSIDLTKYRDEVNRLRQKISNSELIAPDTGVILLISSVPGREVTPGRPVLFLGNPDALEIRSNVDSDILRLLTLDMDVQISHSGSSGENTTGKIKQLPAPYGAAPDGYVHIDFVVSPSQTGYKLANVVDIHIELQRKENVLWLPPQAINRAGDRTFVVIQEGNLQRRQDVKLGISGIDRVEILYGLQQGQVIVVP